MSNSVPVNIGLAKYDTKQKCFCSISPKLPFLVGISENELTCAVLQPQRNFDNVWRNGQVSFAFSHENHVNFQNTKKAQNDQGAFWAARFW